jgi:nitrile hydratase accessory protein
MTSQNELIQDLPLIPHDEDGPVFQAPWEAAAFALAVRLSAEGHFTWPEWTQVFTAEIQKAQEKGDPDLGNTYYHHWVEALERLCEERRLVAHDDMTQRTEEWRQAYWNTPHGKPIELQAAFVRGPLAK